MLAEAQQGFLEGEAFEQGQAEQLAGAFVLAGGALHVAVDEGLRLVVVVGGDERQGVGKGMLGAAQGGAEVGQCGHGLLAWSKAASCSGVASFWCWAFHSA
ncbi:hypothetical protein D3C86_2014170 [compost metagenome]